jgi:serine/threonine protein kinase
MITEGLETTETGPYMSGGSSDVWKGSYQGQQVAIKVIRTYTTGDLAKVKKVSPDLLNFVHYGLNRHQRFYKEVLVWKQLRHPNVLPFQGVATSLFPFCMVSHWMANGNIVEYIEMYDGADRLLLVS